MTPRRINRTITLEQAARLFRGSLRELRYGPLRAVFDLHLPYHLFQVSYGRGNTALIAIDAVTGSLDLYDLVNVPLTENLETTKDQKIIRSEMTVAVSSERLKEKALRMIFLRGFFKQSRIDLELTFLGEVLLPYWIGVFDCRNAVRIEVLDGTRGRLEGAKLREIVRLWLTGCEANGEELTAIGDVVNRY